MTIKHEDSSFKKLCLDNIQGLINVLKIKEIIVRQLPTTDIDLNPKEFELDQLVETESGRLLNLEFQSSKPTNKDFSRFLKYAAFMHDRYQKQINTYIICTAKVTNIKEKHWFSEFCYFKGKIINLSQYNGDKILNTIENKDKLNKEDQMNLLIPLYSTANTLFNQFNKAIDILLNSKNTKLEKRNIAEILFIFADKFLNKKEKEQLKRRVKMKLNVFDEILEEGIEKGIEEGKEIGMNKGREEGIVLTIKQLLEHKCASIEDISKATGLPIEEINKISKSNKNTTIHTRV